ncbi:MAG: 1,4-alpha-glucan branching enzyme, partial [Lachnospiraceae bacterium]|nr:1,4-alpha-glucan branching enzyme [Lachnospiraceae bacterium]
FVKSISVIGDWNGWSPRNGSCLDGGDYLEPVGSSGVWSGLIKGPEKGMCYKYVVETNRKKLLYKADPYAIYSQKRPETASIIWDLKYKWQDKDWMEKRKSRNHFKEPFNIYEVHLGSWRRHPASEDDPDN